MKVFDERTIRKLSQKQVYLFGAIGMSEYVARKLISENVLVVASLVSDRDAYNPSYVIVTNEDQDQVGIPVISYKNMVRNGEVRHIICCVGQHSLSEVEEYLKDPNNILYQVKPELLTKWQREAIAVAPWNYYYREPYLRQVQKICKERGLSQNEEKKVLERAFLRIQDKNNLCLNRLIIMLTTKCTLRCRDCNECIPRYSMPRDYDVSILKYSMDRILTLVDHIAKIELVGGEPFIASNLKSMLEYMLQQEKIDAVEITTNGTVVPREDIIPLLKHKKVYVYVSDYGLYADSKKGVKALQKNKIKYTVMDMSTWIDAGTLTLRHKSDEDMKGDFYRCTPARVCKTLLEDRLFHCSRAVAVYNLQSPDSVESLLVDEQLTKESILAFWTEEYSMACNYCDNAIEERKFIEGGVQIQTG